MLIKSIDLAHQHKVKHLIWQNGVCCDIKIATVPFYTKRRLDRVSSDWKAYTLFSFAESKCKS